VSHYGTFIEGWESINSVDPKSLGEARLTAHWAAQIIGGVGDALVPPEPDFSHTSMEWSNELRALVGSATPAGSRVSLRPEGLTIRVHSPDGTATAIELEGKTLQEALGWVVAELERAEGGALPRTPEIPAYEMPDHAVALGARFGTPDKARTAELARWYANAADLARLISDNTLGASSVRCWPHHFDIATLVTLDPPVGNAESARSIGFGFSPGDTSYAEPYFYVNPWPYPESRDGHPSLEGGGKWHTAGWFGAVLPASSIKGVRREQAGQVLSFAKSAMASNRDILETL
jgi:hypothetical protein